MHFYISENFEEEIFDRVKKGVESEVAAKWIIQLVHALHHLHTHGFFHRGIECFTVFVTSDDNLLIGNFRDMIEADQTDRTDGLIVNLSSPEFCEFVVGRRNSYDMKHDVWMLGFLLFMICNNNHSPFSYAISSDEKD